MKEISVYVLEIILTSAKMQKDSTLLWKNFENWGQGILKVIQVFFLQYA